MSEQKYKLTIEYDGTDFTGWQVQPGKRTVQGEIEAMLSVLFQENCRLTASGRTDSGVHALGQVAHFAASQPRTEYQIRQGLNSLLADDINILRVEKVAADFHARFDAVRRHYKYQIVRGNSAIRRRYAWCLQGDLDVSVMQQCADLIFGEHDFRSFCSASAEVSHYHCSVDLAKWSQEAADSLTFYISANRFLHNMVRVLVGTMVEVGKGRFSVDDFRQMLLKKDRTSAGTTAPACGLFLVKVDY